MALTRYRSLAFDSARWEGFEFRADDIIISTPPKCGTTWTQMICVLLVLQVPELPRPLNEISPWLDMVTRPRSEVFDELSAQRHRRIIKTHTPLDGLPANAAVTYVCVGRDPRDVAISMNHHKDNMDMAVVLQRTAAAAEADGVQAGPSPRPWDRSDSELKRLWQWIEDETPVAESGSTLRYTLHHLRSYWEASDRIDVVFLHYDDLRADLGGQMRSLGHRLGIDVPGDRWPELTRAATFEEMRRRAATTVPGAKDQWKDPSAFFRSGTSGQWATLLDDDGERRYAEHARSLIPPDLSDWLHRPPLPA